MVIEPVLVLEQITRVLSFCGLLFSIMYSLCQQLHQGLQTGKQTEDQFMPTLLNVVAIVVYSSCLWFLKTPAPDNVLDSTNILTDLMSFLCQLMELTFGVQSDRWRLQLQLL